MATINTNLSMWNQLRRDHSFLHWAAEEFNLVLNRSSDAHPVTFYKKQLLARWESLSLFREYLSLIKDGDPYSNMTKVLRYINVPTTEAIGLSGGYSELDVGWVDLDRVVGCSRFSLIDDYLDLLDIIRCMVRPDTQPPICMDVVGSRINVDLPVGLRDYDPLQVIEGALNHFDTLTSTTPTVLTLAVAKKGPFFTMAPREEIRVRTLYELGRKFLPVIIAPTTVDVATTFPHLWEKV